MTVEEAQAEAALNGLTWDLTCVHCGAKQCARIISPETMNHKAPPSVRYAQCLNCANGWFFHTPSGRRVVLSRSWENTWEWRWAFNDFPYENVPQ